MIEYMYFLITIFFMRRWLPSPKSATVLAYFNHTILKYVTIRGLFLGMVTVIGGALY